MAVDGRLSGGFVFVPIKQSISLQADSPSVSIFDAWWTSEQQVRYVYTANGNIVLTSVGLKYSMFNDFLTSYAPVSNAKKVLQTRKFTITWQNIVPAVASSPAT